MKYKTSGVCSRSIDFDVVDNKVTNVHFEGGLLRQYTRCCSTYRRHGYR